MTHEEFTWVTFSRFTCVRWRNDVFRVIGVDFGRGLIGIPATEPKGICWIPYKHLTIVPESK